MRVTIDAQLDYRFPRECDVLLALRARPGSDQYVAEERLSSTGQSRLLDVRYATQNDRRNWMVAEGEVSIRYTASVEVSRAPLALHGRSVPRRPRLPACPATIRPGPRLRISPGRSSVICMAAIRSLR